MRRGSAEHRSEAQPVAARPSKRKEQVYSKKSECKVVGAHRMRLCHLKRDGHAQIQKPYYSIARVYHGHSEITEKTDGSFSLSYLYPQSHYLVRSKLNGS